MWAGSFHLCHGNSIIPLPKNVTKITGAHRYRNTRCRRPSGSGMCVGPGAVVDWVTCVFPVCPFPIDYLICGSSPSRLLLTLSISKKLSVMSALPSQLNYCVFPPFFSITPAKVLPMLPTFSKKPASRFIDSPLAFLASVSCSLHLCHFLPPAGSGFRLLFPF